MEVDEDGDERLPYHTVSEQHCRRVGRPQFRRCLRCFSRFPTSIKFCDDCLTVAFSTKVIARLVTRTAVQIVNREAAIEFRGVEQLGKAGLGEVLGRRRVELIYMRRVSITPAVVHSFFLH